MNGPNALKAFLTRQFHARWRHLVTVGAPFGLALGFRRMWNPSISKTESWDATARHRLTLCAIARILPVLLLLLLPVVAQAQFEYTVANGTVTITGYTGPGGDVVIPETINGLPVTSIGDWAFADCTGLTSVTIPDCVTSIGDWAFSGCTGLRAVYFQGDAPAMGEAVFERTMATLFYLPGTTGWEATIAGRPTVQWTGLFGAQSVEMFAGLTIVGEIGRVYSIEYVTDLTEPTEGDWRCLEYLQLPASPHLWADKSAPATDKRFYRAVAMEAPTNMVFIPPGTFRMGSPTNEVNRSDWEGPQTAVTISRGYWMGKYEVTQGEYEAVMGNNPSYFNGVRGETDYGTDLTRPVEQVSWLDATAYCAALTERERLAGRIPANSVYRLPTEAEWEYACRGWTSTRFSYGDDPGYTNLTNYAWYWDNNQGQTHPVGQKLSNPWGLHDMHGNVFEWCQDWFGDYAGGIALDPQGPTEVSSRVIRGGVWGFWDLWGYAGNCRSADRDHDVPERRYYSIGFRTVLAPGQ